MALDEALAASVRRGASPPLIRLYGWEKPSVTLGRFQRTRDVDVGYCRAEGIPVVRRPTGGRAVLHDDELTYSLSARTDGHPFSKGLLDSYRSISDAVTRALSSIGLQTDEWRRREKGSVLSGSPLCFQSTSYGEIKVAGRKVIGAAQRRWSDGLLQQGSIPFRHNGELLKRICRVRGEDLRQCMTGVRDAMPGLGEDLLKGALIAAFEDRFGVRLVMSDPSPQEAALARELLELKYLQASWNLEFPSRCYARGGGSV